MTTKDCNNCIHGSKVSKSTSKVWARESITLCSINSLLLTTDVNIVHKFCGDKRYVITAEYPCFESGGFD